MISFRFRTIAAVLTMVLVVSAGCTGLGLGGEGASDSLDASDFDAHQSALRDAGSATITMNATVESQGQSIDFDGVAKADFEDERAVSEMTIRFFGGITTSQYYDGTTTYERTESGFAGTQYNASDGDGTFMRTALLNESSDDSATANDSIDVSAGNANLTFERIEGEEGFEGATVFRADESELRDTYATDVDGTLVNATMEMHQTDDDYFNFVHLRLVSEVDGERQLTEFELRITEVGDTDVVEPDWVETAELMTANDSS